MRSSLFLEEFGSKYENNDIENMQTINDLALTKRDLGRIKLKGTAAKTVQNQSYAVLHHDLFRFLL